MRQQVDTAAARWLLDGPRHTHVPSLPVQTICGQLRPPRNLMGDDSMHIRPAWVDRMAKGRPTRTAGAPAPRSGSGAAAARGLPD